jgi:hypothetical protein
MVAPGRERPLETLAQFVTPHNVLPSSRISDGARQYSHRSTRTGRASVFQVEGDEGWNRRHYAI